MKRFLIKVAIFGVLLFGIDRITGYSFTYMSNHARGGYVAHNHYLVDKTSEDMLVFGSSRAIHHYNPQIIEDSLHISCFNCGQEGSGIIQNYGFWTLINDHYKPRYVIYDVFDDFDLLITGDNHKYLGWLKESYDRKGISDIFKAVDRKEQFKMISMMYRYNSKWHQIIGDFIHPVYKVGNKGFIPLIGEMDTMRIANEFNKECEFDTLKIYFLKRFVEEMGDTKLVFVVSPSWYGIPQDHFDPIDSICSKYGVCYLNYANDTRFVHNNEYFKDGGHLNSKGADIFTEILVNDLISKYY